MEDLQRILKQRECLDTTNTVFQYLFFVFQATGIFLVSISNALNLSWLVWLGVFCNAIAGIFNAGYTFNQKQSAKMLKDLQNIKKNKYIDQGMTDAKQGSKDEKLELSFDDDILNTGTRKDSRSQSARMAGKSMSQFSASDFVSFSNKRSATIKPQRTRTNPFASPEEEVSPRSARFALNAQPSGQFADPIEAVPAKGQNSSKQLPPVQGDDMRSDNLNTTRVANNDIAIQIAESPDERIQELSSIREQGVA